MAIIAGSRVGCKRTAGDSNACPTSRVVDRYPIGRSHVFHLAGLSRRGILDDQRPRIMDWRAGRSVDADCMPVKIKDDILSAGNRDAIVQIFQQCDGVSVSRSVDRGRRRTVVLRTMAAAASTSVRPLLTT